MRFSLLGMLLCAAPCAAVTLFVDASATPGGDGLLWSTALADLQDALDMARADPLFTDIHVAAGAYRPDRGTLDQTASFTMIDGVALLGGFPTGGGTVEERNPATHPTILDGDLRGDDLPPDEFGFLGVVGVNADHVVLPFAAGPRTLGSPIRNRAAMSGLWAAGPRCATASSSAAKRPGAAAASARSTRRR